MTKKIKFKQIASDTLKLLINGKQKRLIKRFACFDDESNYWESEDCCAYNTVQEYIEEIKEDSNVFTYCYEWDYSDLISEHNRYILENAIEFKKPLICICYKENIYRFYLSVTKFETCWINLNQYSNNKIELEYKYFNVSDIFRDLISKVRNPFLITSKIIDLEHRLETLFV